MNSSLRYRDQLMSSPYLVDELDALIASVKAAWSAEHTDQDGHGDVTANSIAVAAGATVGADLLVTGDVVADSGTGAEVAMGVLATVNGATFQGGEGALRRGVLIGGVTNGFWIEKRDQAFSPMDAATTELCIWNLALNQVVPSYRLGVLGGVPIIMDGGTGSGKVSLGASVRALGDVFTTAYYRTNYPGVPQGEWSSVTFAAGSFTADAGGSWTLTSGDQTTFKYTLVGKKMTASMFFDTTTIVGAPQVLSVAIPGGYVAAAPALTACRLVDNGANTVGMVFVNTSSTTINFFRSDLANFTANANGTTVRAELTFEVQ